MQEAKELTVILKGDDKVYKEKFLVYEDMILASHDETIKKCIEQAKSHFKADLEEIRIKVSMEL